MLSNLSRTKLKYLIFLKLSLFLFIKNTWAIPSKPYLNEVKNVISEVRTNSDLSLLNAFLSKVDSISINKSSNVQLIIKELNHLMFEELKLTPDTSYLSRENLDNILPDSVLKQKKGHCLGLTTLFILAAERLNQKVYLVHVPDHIFPRICEKDKCYNIEMLKNGEILPDQYYIQNLFIPQESIKNKIYLRSIADPKELSASIYLGLGFVANSSKQFELAELFYKRSIQKNPKFSEAHSNLASILFQFGEKNSAVKELELAFKENPYSYFVNLNLGALKASEKKYIEALGFFNKAIEVNPVSPHGYAKRARVLETLNKMKEAMIDEEKVLIIQPNYCDIRESLISIKTKLSLSTQNDREKLRSLKDTNVCMSIGL